jgi:hypothetical protein
MFIYAYNLVIAYYIESNNILPCARFWLEIPKERDHSEDRGVDFRMGAKWILGRRFELSGI